MCLKVGAVLATLGHCTTTIKMHRVNKNAKTSTELTSSNSNKSHQNLVPVLSSFLWEFAFDLSPVSDQQASSTAMEASHYCKEHRRDSR